MQITTGPWGWMASVDIVANQRASKPLLICHAEAHFIATICHFSLPRPASSARLWSDLRGSWWGWVGHLFSTQRADWWRSALVHYGTVLSYQSYIHASTVPQPPIQVYGVEGRYATALFSAASKQNLLDQVEQELVKVSVSGKSDPNVFDYWVIL